jgi:hypothetical protein
LAPLHTKLDVIRVDTAILGERNAEFVLVLGDGELARNVLVDFNRDADAFNARVVDGRLVRGGLAVEVDVGLEADVDVARSVAEVDRWRLGTGRRIRQTQVTSSLEIKSFIGRFNLTEARSAPWVSPSTLEPFWARVTETSPSFSWLVEMRKEPAWPCFN